MNFNRGVHFEERLLQSLLADHKFAEQMVEVLDVEYFNLEYVKEIVKIFFNYHKKYSAFPSFKLFETDIVPKEVSSDVLREKIQAFFLKIKERPLNGDLEYVKEESLDFCRKRKLQLALENAVDLAKEKKYDEIVHIVQKALQAGSERDIGHIYHDQFDSRMIFEARNPVSTGWDEIDKILDGGLAGGQLGVFCAPTGVGKSHCLVNVGVAAAKAGKNVAHYTLELSEKQIANRYDAHVSNIAVGDLIANKERVRDAIAKVPGKIIVKGYPTKTASCGTIKANLQKLTMKDMKPDILLIDYADIMRSRKGYDMKRYELETIYEDLRALAMEYDIPIWTCSQTNRTSVEDDIISLSSIAESFAKAMIADVIVSMSRKTEDRLSSTGRFHIAKNRSGPDGLTFPLLVNTATSRIQVLKPGALDGDPDDPNDMHSRLQKQFKKFQSTSGGLRN
jgi:replicative DNA helicase